MATRGRPKRKRSPGAGKAIKVKPHTRNPRGNNKKKPKVKVDNYLRGKPRRKKQQNKARKRSSG